MNPFTSQSILYFASRSLCTTEAWVTTRWAMKFVYKVGSTIFSKNICWGFAIVSSINKADLPAKRYRRPLWDTTSLFLHTCCWHFCSCSSHETISSLRELIVTQQWTVRCYANYISLGFTQVFMMMTKIGYKVRWKLQEDWGYWNQWYKIF